jgi:hypothetical protein
MALKGGAQGGRSRGALKGGAEGGAEPGRLSWWLLTGRRFVRRLVGGALAGAGLLLPAPQVFAQRARQALFARGLFLLCA